MPAIDYELVYFEQTLFNMLFLFSIIAELYVPNTNPCLAQGNDFCPSSHTFNFLKLQKNVDLFPKFTFSNIRYLCKYRHLLPLLDMFQVSHL